MGEKIPEQKEKKEKASLKLNFLGAMPGYGREYRLSVESGMAKGDLWMIADKLKNDLPEWQVECRDSRIEIIPPVGATEPHRVVAAAVQKAVGQAKVTGNMIA